MVLNIEFALYTRGMIIAVDGPTASGKGTIAKALAAHFELPHLDHRIAMSMAIAGLASRHGIEVDDTRPIATSFPVFETLLAEVST